MRIADYRDIEILPDSIIYADPPYYNVGGYRDEVFDHRAFYDWCAKQTAPLFISEYYMPDGFTCIASFDRVSTFSATNNKLKKVEKIFVPNHQKDVIERFRQKSLFDDI